VNCVFTGVVVNSHWVLLLVGYWPWNCRCGFRALPCLDRDGKFLFTCQNFAMW